MTAVTNRQHQRGGCPANVAGRLAKQIGSSTAKIAAICARIDNEGRRSTLRPQLLRWGISHLNATRLDPQHAVYVGSFDPVTLGHEDVIRRGARLFGRLTVGVGVNPEKKSLFTSEERMELIQQVVAPLKNVDVGTFHGLSVDFVRACGAGVMLRGVRTLTDIEAEFTMSLANQVLAPDIESVFLMSNERYTHISSTLIKQIAQLGQGSVADHLQQFVPEAVIAPLLEKLRGPRA
jgi:pantetheine-phosphate adenylyltransferase